ncbi:MAG: hypothetical protein LLF96_11810 [Eubacteriales bacterium]|nr:hypothetical protein [Eubacteriales bacterium]
MTDVAVLQQQQFPKKHHDGSFYAFKRNQKAFRRMDDTWMQSPSGANKYTKELTVKVPVKRFRLYFLNYLQMWVQSGGELCTLSEILGHTNVAFTMQRYVHGDTAAKRRGMEAMASLIRK